MILFNYNTKVIFLSLAIIFTFLFYDLKAQNLKDITEPPADSADAENLRIWYSIERPSRCRMDISITDMKRTPVRTLLDQPMGKGYYNFYWDKKDDSGRYVEPGRYFYKIDDCGKIKYGNLIVEYKKWENTSFIFQDTLSDSVRFNFGFLEDSARVTLEVFKGYKTPLGSPIVDSLMNRGEYSFTWRPDENVKPGWYTFKWHVDDYVREFKVNSSR